MALQPRLFLLLTAVLGMLTLVPTAAVLAVPPTLNLNVPGSRFVGQNFNFDLTFDNSGATGYGPYVDVFLPQPGIDGPASGPNDGISFVNVTYAGNAVNTTTLTCANPPGNTVHPLTGLTVNCPATPANYTGPLPYVWQMLVVELPFPSFTAGQAPVQLDFTANISDFADVGQSLPIYATPGFRYGTDPLGLSPPSIGATDVDTLTPNLFNIDKDYDARGNPNLPGPNFRHRYTLRVDLAQAQRFSPLTITDILPPNIVYLGIISTSPGGATVLTQPPIGVASTAPNNVLSVTWGNINGAGAGTDASVTFEFYVPNADASGNAVINPNTCADTFANNTMNVAAVWQVRDPRDGAPVSVSANDTHSLRNECLTFDKSANNLTDSRNSPGDIIEYTLRFTVSDYFSLGNLVINDVLGDGLRFFGTPTLSFRDAGNNFAAAAMNPANYIVDTSRFPPAFGGTGACGDGSTRLTFNVSNEMIARGGDGVATGGRVGGSFQPTFGEIRFRARIQDLFACTPGDISVDNNDTLTNSATITSVIHDNVTQLPLPSNPTVTETDSANINVAGGSLTKTVYARNGVVGPVPQVSPAETLTYRLRYTFPNGADFENFRIQDFLPLTIFLASEVTTFNPTICGVPAAGVACYGPANTFTAVIPTITSNVPDNWIQFNFGTYDDPINAPVEVDIVFTVTATSSPIADGMIFTNVATARRGTTSGSTITQTSIVQTRYTQPVLTIRKGIVATNAILPSFIGTPVLPGGVTISAPGSTCPRVTGTVNHANYTAGGFNSNLANADVGDLVTFVIIIENTGRSPNGAFDVRVRDDLPAGLAIPTGGAGLNLCVRSGAGANLPFTNIGTGLFDPAGGIELTDPSPILGALRSDRNPSTGAYGNSGNNIAVITFDLQVVNPAALGQTITNTGTLFNYAGNEGGTDFTTVDPTDPASIIVGGPRPTKQLISTSESHTLDSPAPAAVAVGEIARFRLYIRLSEGTFGGASGIQLRDNLPTGFTFLDDGSARFAFLSSGAGITSTTLTCPNVTPYTQTDAALANIPSSSITCAFPDAAVSRSAAVDDDNYASGDDVFFSLGSLTNADNDPAQPEFIVVEFNALVNNSATNNAGVSLDNTFRLRLNGVDVGADSNSVQVRVNEPSLTISKDFTTIPVDAGDTAVFTITVTANGGADTTAAFDVTLTDVLNANFNPVSVTAATTSGACGGTAANTSASFSGQTMNGAVTCMNPNTTATFVITATLRDNVGVCTTLSNTVAMVYTSLPGANGSSPNSSGSVTPGSAGSINGERNGSGGINDYTGTSSVSTSICSAPTFDKLAVSPALYTLGDSIIYNILVTLPEGTSNGMSLLDDLPAGLNYVPGSAQIITTAAASGGILSADFAGTVPAPTVTAPGGSGADVTLAFGAIVTTGDNNAANNSFVVQLRALVMGSVSTNVDGAALTNNASLTYDNNGTPATLTDPTPPTITVIEPQITTTKSVTPSTNVQAGDDLTYTVRFTNTGRATAYDVTADDVLAPGTDFILSSPAAITCTTNFGAGTIAGTITDNGATLRFDGSPAGGWDIPATNPDSYIECSYAVRVLSSVLVNSSSVNTIDADWSSQDGTSSGDERVYTDVNSSPVDGTQDTATATFTVPTPTFDKSDGGAGALPVVPIGAAVTYTLTITSPLGTIRNLSIVDNLPAGLVYNSDAVFSGITGAAALVSAPNDGTAPVSVTWNLGNAVVSSSPATITFTASVANVPANVGGLVLTNSASMQYSSGAGVPQPLITDSDPFTIAGEPLITTTKSVNPTTGVRAGDMVTYTVRFTNTGAGTAFDVTALDLIPAGTDYTGPAAIVCTTNFGTGTLDGTITDNGTSLTFDGSPAGGWDIPAG
ncbi:MAG: DUF11 domain-containing protein, partial [Chloroflexi bacterium]|nr:DUF11 domain-containing protein [Chloroflexota bacterium]